MLEDSDGFTAGVTGVFDGDARWPYQDLSSAKEMLPLDRPLATLFF